MAKKKQKIRVVVHMNTNSKKVFNTEIVQTFWVEKITAKVQERTETGEEAHTFIKEIVEKPGTNQ